MEVLLRDGSSGAGIMGVNQQAAYPTGVVLEPGYAPPQYCGRDAVPGGKKHTQHSCEQTSADAGSTCCCTGKSGLFGCDKWACCAAGSSCKKDVGCQ